VAARNAESAANSALDMRAAPGRIAKMQIAPSLPSIAICLFFLSSLFCPVVSAQQSPAQLATVTLETKALGRRIPRDFVGFSLEVSTAGQGLPTPAKIAAGSANQPGVPQYALGSPGAPNEGFFRFMRNLRPGVLRLGGNSQDNTCWNPSAAPHGEWCKGTLTPAIFQLFATAAKASGWQLIVGLNLKQNSPGWALSEVTEGIAKEIDPEEVLGLEIGNEPDLFNRGFRPTAYSVADLVKDFGAYEGAFKADPVAKRFAVVGPAVCCRWDNAGDLGAFIDGVGAANLKLVTVHKYPLTTCNGHSVTIQQLLAPEVMEHFNEASRKLVAAAQERKLPVALAETNSASCGGMPGVSNSFASALWGLDWLFSAAQDGFSEVNFHTSYRAGGSSYDPVDSYGQLDVSHRVQYENVVRPLYYAMYLFARHASGEYLLPTKIRTRANVRAFATTACANCAVNIVVVNKDPAASGRVKVHLRGRAGTGKLLLLTAPKLDSQSPQVISYGGGRFDQQGRIGAPATEPVKPDSNGSYNFELPHAAVAVLTIPATQASR
jgi:hypothetical protein